MSQKKINESIQSKEIKRVWVGDPCYVIADELWDSVCDQTFKDHKEVGFVIVFSKEDFAEAGLSCPQVKSLSFIQCGTAYGDGYYPSMTGTRYPVDAGCLGVVPDYLIADEKYSEAERLGKFFEVDCDAIYLETDGEGTFEFSYSKGARKGTFEMIYTGDEEEDDYEEDYEEEDDE